MTRNLLDNAVRYCPVGASLRIDLRQKGEHAVLLIADAGPGMDAAQSKHLFQAFATERPVSGSGLGLTIAREMVLALGGEISLENRCEASRVVGLDALIRLPINGTDVLLYSNLDADGGKMPKQVGGSTKPSLTSIR